jgi:hypothetical protein
MLRFRREVASRLLNQQPGGTGLQGVVEKSCDWQLSARTDKAAASPLTWQLD